MSTTIQNQNQTPIYRFKFSQEFTELLFQFSKVHQYDDRKVFKEEWEKWVEENRDDYDVEIRRLTELGYEGDIEDKMFKSARYYYRKKLLVRPEVKDRRQYITVNKSFIKMMDKHITDQIAVNTKSKPSSGFDLFCREYRKDIVNELIIIMNNNNISSDEIERKVKKTYKNRYFLMVRKPVLEPDIEVDQEETNFEIQLPEMEQIEEEEEEEEDSQIESLTEEEPVISSINSNIISYEINDIIQKTQTNDNGDTI